MNQIFALFLIGQEVIWLAIIAALSVVFITIIMLAMRRRDRQALSEPGRKPVARQIPVEAGDDSEELIAVLTAAAHEMLHKQVVVRSFSFLSNDENHMWSVSGRINIMASHLIVKRKQ